MMTLLPVDHAKIFDDFLCLWDLFVSSGKHDHGTLIHIPETR